MERKGTIARKLIAAASAVAVTAAIAAPVGTAADRADNTITITCVDFLGTTYQVVDVHAGYGIAIGNANYTANNGFGGTCSQ